MGRKKQQRKHQGTNQSFITTTVLPILFLFIFGLSIANETDQDFLTMAILVSINIGIFRLLGLHKAFRRTRHVQYWKLKQKVFFVLYLFLTTIMFGSIFTYGEMYISLAFFVGLLFFGVRIIWISLINLKSMLPSLENDKRSKIKQITIDDIDKMEGTEFEVYLSNLYDQMGYFAELPPHNDYGIDVIIIKDKIKTGIQAKWSWTDSWSRSS